MQNLYTAVSFDMRAPAFGTATADLYAAALEMAAYADDFGIDRIGLMEHHASEDGYLPTPFVLGGGIAARTRQCRMTLGAVILPLHDPVKIAEQIAVLDLMSNGRLDVIFGAGYVEAEFNMFGVSLRERGKLLDKGLEIITRALDGERFEVDGRTIYVRPLPVQEPKDIILVGGGVPASARRAARFGLGFGPMRRDLIPLYEEECRKLGREPAKYYAPSHQLPLAIHLSEDPDKGWEQIKAHALHVVREYAKWAEQEPNSNSPFKGLTDEAALRASGLFAVWTPDELVQRAANIEPGATLGIQPLLGGLSPDVGWSSLELFKSCMPRLAELRQQRAANA
ncbi:LLM class flavin-dependent oxidoreductase [Mangrovimicrobium sediminis]|uniref:LLM class flavin-dependent oxidoreductase n=1 Tax=Mangrovimicrobium sediminis TaxID=2562682 RepID=A0A4Z0MA24_9GAMM|nr:LLM class flavin-dependent oxidoreductase [Haliea sp. SAOS-164]TGD76228.1 LLM class flavin-dependent oxidoreductase [Haliea sp. SAOS-164]